MNTNTTRWWWKKSSNSSKSDPIPTTLNEPDEEGSVCSYGDSLTPYPVSSSMRAQRTRSEYSANFSTDVESTASIRSKPWVSKHVDHESLEDSQSIRSRPDSIASDNNVVVTQPLETKKGTLVDYIVNKPLQLKVRLA
ncbi:hypothetical protein A0J61_09054 [Choanephora cucurbitarum]|uniref:Uncharacterized protein n=1 Tax=Choanephora cucurbitarum TaxID=101091 RepID=A0A1C7N1P1_9FUNG|nr:hypothetical protein A0J61_09054 [Choanephora cucurbitarum]